jgi:chromate reductase
MAVGAQLEILAFAGALRAGSLNKKLCTVAVERLRALGANVDHLDFREVEMPVYDGDAETATGLPPGAQELRRRIGRVSAVLLVSPEYNASIPGPLKNAIDWSSRGADQPWKGKVVALMAASPGAFGGARMLPDLRKVMSVLGAVVIPTQVTLPRAGEAFDEAGQLKDARAVKTVDGALAELVALAGKLA